jgi:hypothetical protein
MKIRFFYIVLFTSINYSFGQVNLIIPTKGVDGVPVVLDSSTISDVITFYGSHYLKKEFALVTEYLYDKLGLTFTTDPFDKNRIIRSIFVEFPFLAKTSTGIVLNESTMNEVYNIYKEKGCFTSGEYAWRPQKGISFYMEKNPKRKGFNPNGKISKIEIHNKDKFGFSSQVGFEFNNEPVEKKVQQLISILNNSSLNFEHLDSFWVAEQTKVKEHYGLQKAQEFKRDIEFGLTQEFTEIRMVRSTYKLNIIKSDGELVFLQLINQNTNNIVFERNSFIKVYNKLKQTGKTIDTSSAINLPIEVYTYGTFCGLHGLPPEKCKVMLNLVNENNYNQLANWLNSLNPEIATYGYIGLYFLKRQGINILQSEVKRMVEVSKSGIQLNTCNGCLFGVTEKICDELQELNLNRIYHTFQQAGFLK